MSLFSWMQWDVCYFPFWPGALFLWLCRILLFCLQTTFVLLMPAYCDPIVFELRGSWQNDEQRFGFQFVFAYLSTLIIFSISFFEITYVRCQSKVDTSTIRVSLVLAQAYTCRIPFSLWPILVSSQTRELDYIQKAKADFVPHCIVMGINDTRYHK